MSRLLADPQYRLRLPPKTERELLSRHLGTLTRHWNEAFPGFPEQPFPFSSARGLWRRGRRDAYLRGLVTRLTTAPPPPSAHRLIVNPACVFGRHARALARVLPDFQVVGSDINPRLNRLYRLCLLGRTPSNYSFVREDIFAPQPDRKPHATVFFGACGSISDAAMEYAIRSGAPLLICRTCCHDNIAGNTSIPPRPTPVNVFFRWKNRLFARIQARQTGEYFSPHYAPARYPLSQAARGICDTATLLQWSRHSVESDLCRTLIDLDRYLRLAEAGYRVHYRGELFVAQRIAAVAPIPSL